MSATPAVGQEEVAPQAVTVAERPDLVEAAWLATNDLMPEYNNHGDTLAEYWPRLTEELPEYQFHLVDEHGEILARARSIPVRWDGTTDDLPDGIDGALARGFDGRQPDVGDARKLSTFDARKVSSSSVPCSQPVRRAGCRFRCS